MFKINRFFYLFPPATTTTKATETRLLKSIKNNTISLKLCEFRGTSLIMKSIAEGVKGLIYICCIADILKLKKLVFAWHI